jgi:FKBP-type peptidyl-prolyl cis-trans isomerase 2
MKITKLLALSVLTLSSIFILAWCSTQKVAQWDTITVSYDSYLQNGKIISDWEEITFTVWLWQTFPIFDTVVVDMKKGDTKEFMATIEEWYGIYHDATKIQNITTTIFNKIWIEPQIWETIELWDLKGLILELGPITNKVDFNKIQTREPVEFKIEILDIEEIE